MSRVEFRAKVTDPRPASAWVLVTVASATLWITQQLDLWAQALQMAALLFSLWRRERPFEWQKSPIALNVGMFGIATATTLVALRGEPSTIALAHFAALTQGLQLLDARPRHTEFLLVTLALFQVVLASNLTDSVFFPPLLVAFVFAAVWTLIVHTLRTEAIEAGLDVRDAITPGLLRTTLFASALTVALALVLFVVLPRMRSSVFQGTSVPPRLASAGFSDRVQLGDLGRIRLDPTVVMRVETLSGTPSEYWRGLAFDHFDGTSWSITPNTRRGVAGSPEGGVDLGRDHGEPDLVQRIVREPVESGVIFASGDASHLQGTVRRMERDVSGGLYAMGQADERIRYTLATHHRRVHDRDLRDHSVVMDDPRHLQVPDLSPRVGELAREITAGARSDAERSAAIASHLLRHGVYSNVPPEVPEGGAPIEAFLFGGLGGHCEYFASSMVLLARHVGLPARLVNGFAGGRQNGIGEFTEVTRSDAHTWVEIHFEEAGWVRYDPTPPDLRARSDTPLSLADLASALELWWFQRVVGFDRSDQIDALKRAWVAWRKAKPRAREQLRVATDLEALAGSALPWVAAAGVGVLLLVFVRRGPSRSDPLPAAYRKALRILSRRGWVRDPGQTARDFAREVDSEAFDAITEAYLAERFGDRPASGCADHLVRLRHEPQIPQRSAQPGHQAQ